MEQGDDEHAVMRLLLGVLADLGHVVHYGLGAQGGIPTASFRR